MSTTQKVVWPELISWVVLLKMATSSLVEAFEEQAVQTSTTHLSKVAMVGHCLCLVAISKEKGAQVASSVEEVIGIKLEVEALALAAIVEVEVGVRAEAMVVI